jgi:hypothetical protein
MTGNDWKLYVYQKNILNSVYTSQETRITSIINKQSLSNLLLLQTMHTKFVLKH